MIISIATINYNFGVENHTDKRLDNNSIFYLSKDIPYFYSNQGAPPPNNVNDRVRWARLNMYMTQVELARKINCVPATIIMIEKTGHYNIATLKKISDVLEQPIEFLGCFENMSETTFGERLKKARYYHGYEKKEAAKVLGFNKRTLYYGERDIREPIADSLDKLNPFINILNHFLH